MSKSISVALATYNGLQYIKTQLESIISQTIPPTEIVIVDDASSDETLKLLNSIIQVQANQSSLISFKLYSNSVNLGCKASFQKALEHTTGNYIFLSDQDDVWRENKIEIYLDKLATIDTTNPLLIFSDLTLVDQSLNILSPSHHRAHHVNMKNYLTWPTSTVVNFVSGCSLMINRQLLEKALPFPDECLMHDWWLAIMGQYLGKIYYLPVSTIFYRQHSSNHSYITKTSFELKHLQKSLPLVQQQNKLTLILDQLEFFAKKYKIEKFIRALPQIKKGGLLSVLVVLKLKLMPDNWYRKINFLLKIFLRFFLVK
jgi:glycosyltransferase involved in cell wall biosynthesis